MKVVIVGAGDVGFYFAEWLSSEQKEVVVIDKDENALRHMTDHPDIQTLHGSGSNPRVLEDAGVAKSDFILAVTDSDEVNLDAERCRTVAGKLHCALAFPYLPIQHERRKL